MRTRLSPARRVVLLLGGAVVLGFIANAVLTLVALMGHTTTAEASTSSAAGRALVVRVDSGDVNVQRSPDGQVHLETQLRYGLSKPRVERRPIQDGIELTADCRWYDRMCEVRHTISVPAATELDVSTGSGDVRVSGLSGATRVRTGSGDVRVEDVTGPLTLRTGSGDVTGRELASPTAAVRVGSGDVHLELLEAPDDVTVSAGSGDVLIFLPAGTPYATDVDTGSGDELVAVPTDPTAASRLRVRTGSGDVGVVLLRFR